MGPKSDKKSTSATAKTLDANNKPNEKVEANQSFDAAFELTGHGRMNYLAILSGGLLLMQVTTEGFGLGFVMPAASCEMDLSDSQQGLLAAATFIGIFIASIISGFLSDVYGRRTVLIPAVFLGALMSSFSSVCNIFITMFFFRVLTGIFVAVPNATVYGYVGEMTVNAKRSTSVSLASGFISIGMILLPIMAWIVLPISIDFYIVDKHIVSWRIFMWLWPVPGLLGAVLLISLPESPRYLVNRKSPEAALKALSIMYAKNNRKKPEDFPVKQLIITKEPQRGGLIHAVKDLRLLLKPPLLYCMLLSHINIFTMNFCSGGIYVWAPHIVNEFLENTELSICANIQREIEDETMKSTASLYFKDIGSLIHEYSVDDNCHAFSSSTMYPISIAMGIYFGVVYIAIGILINYIGMRKLYAGVCIFCTVCLMSVGYIANGWLAVFILVLALASGCAATIIASMLIEVMPTNIRVFTLCSAFMFGRGGSAFGSALLGTILKTYCAETFLFYGLSFLVSICLLIFWPNVKKTREKIKAKGYIY